jgi:uncharacterized protein (DUF885 family)
MATRHKVNFPSTSLSANRYLLELKSINHDNKTRSVKMKRKLVSVALTLALSALLSACSEPSSEVSTPPSANINSNIESSQTQLSESERINQWFEKKYEEQLMMSPLTLTSLGRKERYGEIDDFSEEAENEEFKWLQQSVEELKSSFKYSMLDDSAKMSYDLWLYSFEVAQTMRPFQRNAYIFDQMMAIQSQLPTMLINFHKVESEQDMLDYISRIKGISQAIDDLIVRSKLNAEEGVRPPYFAYQGVIKQAENLISGAPFSENMQVDAPLFADAKTKIDELVTSNIISEARADSLKAEAEQALLTYFKPSYEALINWQQSDMQNASAQAQGASSLPNGAAYYNAKLFDQTTTRLSADEIHAIGLSEVDRLLAEMESIKKQVGFEGSLQEFFAFIKDAEDDERFYYPDTDEGRQGYLDDSTEYLAFIDSKLPDYFGILPKAGLVVKRVEAFREQPGAAQHYSAGTPDGSRDGVYYAHLSDMKAMPKNEMEAIAYHEGSPGHHMQISIAQELEGVPTFRTQQFFNGYVEGWALYSELLAKEMGAYQNPYSDFGRLVTEMWRAIRLVVDTGIHSKGWTEEQAVEYFEQNSPISEGQIRSEVQRYFVMPGQATGYKIGMIKILELREKAKQALGDKFDIRAFHDVVLGGGAVPITLLEQTIDEWIAQTISR